jgi:ABC-type multidrug transport system fused ATPase/permease subunit
VRGRSRAARKHGARFREVSLKLRRAIELADVSPIRIVAIAVFGAGVGLSELAGISAFLALLYLPAGNRTADLVPGRWLDGWPELGAALDESPVAVLAVALGFLLILRAALSAISQRVVTELRFATERNIRRSLFRRFLRLPYQRFLVVDHASLQHAIQVESWNVASALASTAYILSEALILTTFVIVLMIFAPYAVFLIGLGLLLSSLILLRRSSDPYGHGASLVSEHKDFVGILQRSVSAFETLKAFSLAESVKGSFIERCERIYTLNLAIDYAQIANQRWLEIGGVGFACATVALIFATGSPKAPAALLVIAVVRMLPRVRAIVGGVLGLHAKLPAIQLVLDTDESLPATSDADGTALTGPASGKADITVREVHFCYAPGRWVFRCFSLHANAGEIVWLSGPSGSGKSTLLLLVAGLLQPAEGIVSVGGIAPSSLSDSARFQLVHLTSQRSQLVGGTLYEALAASRAVPPAESEVWAAIKSAGADRLVSSFRGGLQTPVEEIEQAISFGETKRLLLARAYLSQAPVILLDEPFQGIDRDSRAALFAALAEHNSGALVVISGHDPVDGVRIDRHVALGTHAPRVVGEAHPANSA